MRRTSKKIIFTIILVSLLSIPFEMVSAEPQDSEEESTSGLFLEIDIPEKSWVRGPDIEVRMNTSFDYYSSTSYIFQYQYTTNGSFANSTDWIDVEDHEPVNGTRTLISRPKFCHGKNNWIRFKVDYYNGTFDHSNWYNIWLNNTPIYYPEFDLVSHDRWEWYTNSTQTIIFKAWIYGSEINISSLEYRVTTRGLTHWSPWKKFKNITVREGPLLLSFNMTFRRGDDNYVQARGKNLHDGSMACSNAYNIKINTYPVIMISSPGSGDDIQTDVRTLFDARSTYDPDGGFIYFNWTIYRDGYEEIFESSPVFYHTFQFSGEYLILLQVVDEYGNQVEQRYIIEVEGTGLPPYGDEDGDGMENWFEKLYQLDPLKDDSREDPDNDGFSNLEEFNGGSNPWSSNSVPPLPESDDDDDGLPFWFENRYELVLNLDDSGEDPDGDGYTNLQEYENGTDPTDGLSFPVMDDIGLNDTDSEDDPIFWPDVILIILTVTTLLVLLTGIFVYLNKDES